MEVGIIITTFNRPAYLKRCLDSVKRSDLSQVTTVMIIDDCSTDAETIKLINDLELDGVDVIKVFSKENRSIKGSLLYGCDMLFISCDAIVNLDGDAIVSSQFVNVLMKLKEGFPEHLLTGFNCLTKNKDGSVRHKVLGEGEGYNYKASVGGINMVFDNNQYEKWIRPSLVECLVSSGNWDHKSCLRSQADGKFIICSVPSVVQHLGETSSMNHSAGGEPMDVADDFEAVSQQWYKVKLPNVTAVCVDCVDLQRVYKASDKCLEGIMFEDVLIFTSLSSDKNRCENFIEIDQINTKEEYSWFIMKKLSSHIKTSHILIFQHDGYVLNPMAWDAEWLKYDYIGAPWEWYADNKIGNGGFSLRSKKLMDIVANDPALIPVSDGVNVHKEEDHCLGRIYRKYLEDRYDIKFAPLEVARRFSIEGWRSDNRTWTNEFGFHGNGITNIKP